MDNRDKFIVDYVTKEIFEVKQEQDDSETNFEIVESQHTFEIKQEQEDIETKFGIVESNHIFEPEPIRKEFQEDSSILIYRDVKLEPQYSDHNYVKTYQSFSEEVDTPRSKKRKPKNLEIKNICKDQIRNLQCSICGKQFVRVTTYERHIVSHGTTGSLYECDVCGAMFKVKKNLRAHMATHSELSQNKVRCKICGKWFDRKYLNLHESRHNIEDRKPSHKCSICGKLFLISANLSAHIRRHKKRKTSPCTVCGKTFVVRESLAVHQRVHSGEKVTSV